MDNKLDRVLHACKYYPPEKGGIEYVSEQYVEFYESMYYANEVIAFTSSKSTNCERRKNFSIFRFPCITLASQPLSVGYLKKFIKLAFSKPDVVHVHLPNYLAVFGVLCSFWTHRKLLIHWHADSTSIKYHPILILDILIVLLAQKVIFTSREYYDYSPIRFFCRPGKVSIIPLTIKQPLWDENYVRPEDEVQILEKKIKLLSIGRLVPYKGYQDLLRDLACSQTNFNLTIVGNGPERKRLEMLVQELGLQDKVEFKFGVSDDEKYSLLKSSDALVLYSNSRAEAFGVVILEAFSCGVPVITKFNPGSGMRGLNIDGITGYEVSNSKELTLALEKIAQCDDEYQQLRKNSRIRATKYSNDNAIKALKCLLT